MDFVIKKQNHVLEKQKAMQAQAGKQFVYKRGNGRIYFPIYMAVFGAGFVGTMYQLVQYGNGTVKKSDA
ncbi:hypothetical protein NliqN6_3466 [Naganishia liquefaciens]|uniref:Uncharacterized protein n=1 Tax=Naganishia liquefaciens TaxID=104408 RepID=A0A8H3TVQ9_9TREE|nr:hypothetical protein NliqN6_3466 [Naganishia liquefaciens]